MAASRSHRPRRYAWPRFWTTPGLASEHAFFPDPEGLFAPVVDAFALHEMLDDRCLVLLGEPGLGKSDAINDAVSRLGKADLAVHLVNLGAYDDGESLISAIVDAPAWRTWLATDATLHVFLDGLDEALLHVRSIHKRLIVELQGLEKNIARLRLRVSCRSADWQSDFDEQLAAVFLPECGPRRLQLAPLRVVDVVVAAQAEGIDSDAFIDEIYARDLARLAAYPLTLRMLLDAAAMGALPETRAQLFDAAIIRLAQEHDSARRRERDETAMHVGQRIAVAERIAAATLLSGKTAISGDSGASPGAYVRMRELVGYSEEDAEAAGDAHFEVDVVRIKEVLATALFVDLGGSRLAFRHRSIGEFLAARYLLRHHMETEQIVSLLTSAEDPDGRLIPQLREIAAWVGAKDASFFGEVLAREPDVLLRADNVDLPADARARIVQALLSEDVAIRVDRWDRRIRAAFANLRHPELASQLCEGLSSGQPLTVRRMAITISQVCRLPELQATLLALALDDEETAHFRSSAIWALKDYADDETREALVPLAIERIGDDDDDEIKGQALAATFPSHIAAAEVLRALTPARNEHLLGAYKSFVASALPRALTRTDIPGALVWAAGVPREFHATTLLPELTDDILAVAWSFLDDSEIVDGVIAVILPRLAEHMELLGPLHDSSDDRTFRDAAGRKLLVSRLIEGAAAAEIETKLLPFSTPPLVVVGDFEWVTDHLRAALGTPQEQAWADLTASLYAPETCDVDEVFALAEESSALKENLRPWTEPVALDSPLAQFARRRAEANRDSDSSSDAPDMDKVIVEQLEATEAGDVDAWWQLNLSLIYDHRGQGDPEREIEADLTALDGWQRAGELERARIIQGALRYLEARGPEADIWFDSGKIHRPAYAGYRALYLLAMFRPADLESLQPQVWARWMPIIVRYPRSSGAADDRFDDAIVDLAVRRAPEVVAQWVMREIDIQNARSEGHLFVLWRLRRVNAPAVVAAMSDKLSDPALTPQARGDLAAYGIRMESEAFLPAIAAHLDSANAREHQEEAVSVGAAVFAHAPGVSWPLIDPLIHAVPEVGKQIVEQVAYRHSADAAGQLDDTALHRFLVWMFEYFPPGEDPDMQTGANFVSPREEVGHLRNRLLAVLAQRGTNEAVAAVDALENQFGGHVLQRLRHDAREARLARWKAPEPGHVIRLAQSNDARIVFSSEQLQLAVLASLHRIQKKLQEGNPPTVRELWNTWQKPRPKHEEELSTWLAGRLDDDLRVGGRVIGRELEIRPNPTGKGSGERIDVAVFAPIGDRVEGATTASVLIEGKGCWHADVRTAMTDQLADRYLTGAGTRHGVYLVFWFIADEWDTDDWRRNRCPADIDAMAAFFDGQACAVSAGGYVSVRAFVLNGSLHPHVGAARRGRS